MPESFFNKVLLGVLKIIAIFTDKRFQEKRLVIAIIAKFFLALFYKSCMRIISCSV